MVHKNTKKKKNKKSATWCKIKTTQTSGLVALQTREQHSLRRGITEHLPYHIIHTDAYTPPTPNHHESRDVRTDCGQSEQSASISLPSRTVEPTRGRSAEKRTTSRPPRAQPRACLVRYGGRVEGRRLPLHLKNLLLFRMEIRFRSFLGDEKARTGPRSIRHSQLLFYFLFFFVPLTYVFVTGRGILFSGTGGGQLFAAGGPLVRWAYI